MPFYEYRAADAADAGASEPSGCRHCREGFTVLEKLSADPLDACPGCGGPVRRVISAPQVVSGKAHMHRADNIEKHGFTQYKKIGKGVYEKTAGKGPGIISDD